MTQDIRTPDSPETPNEVEAPWPTPPGQGGIPCAEEAPIVPAPIGDDGPPPEPEQQ